MFWSKKNLRADAEKIVTAFDIFLEMESSAGSKDDFLNRVAKRFTLRLANSDTREIYFSVNEIPGFTFIASPTDDVGCVQVHANKDYFGFRLVRGNNGKLMSYCEDSTMHKATRSAKKLHNFFVKELDAMDMKAILNR
jgi:hypothetical protein